LLRDHGGRQSLPTLKDVLNGDHAFEEHFADLRSSTKSLDKYYKAQRTNTMHPNETAKHELLKQHSALVATIEALEQCSSSSSILGKRWEEFSNAASGFGENSFSDICRRVRDTAVPTAAELRQDFCRLIVSAYKKNTFDELFRVFTNLLANNQSVIPLDPKVAESSDKLQPTRIELLSGFDRAFKNPYHRHALDSFIEFGYPVAQNDGFF
jgi:hypothetical protein